jgi:CxxC-x17-CxxC domain-containing protein
MHTVTCADCGDECQIPFEPKFNRPVYCSECFQKNKPQESRDRYSRDERDSNQDNYRTSRSKSAKFLKKTESFYSNGSEKFYASLKEKLFEILGGKICSSCGFKDERALGFNHVTDGDAFDSIRRSGFASSWGKYISEPELAKKDLRVLCLNCNEIRQPVTKYKKPKTPNKKSKYFPR